MSMIGMIKDIKPADADAMSRAVQKWNGVAKPLGSLGRLEDAITCIAGIRGSENVRLDRRALIVFAADNGVLAQGVAQTPGEVTAIMTGFIADGRSSVCRMAQCAKADVTVADMGMFTRIDAKNLRDLRIADGTKDFTQGAAMSREEAERAIEAGISLVREKKDQGYDIIATGEMGIGNTTTSSAVASVLIGRSIDEMTGRGAGLADEGLSRKKEAIERGIAVNSPDRSDPIDVLSKLGGFDIAGMTGVFLGGAIYRVPILIDGFISSVAALIAARLEKNCVDYMIASHVSAEPAGMTVLDALNKKPIICADMRLGEGTGAVAALPLLDMALSVYDTACTYADIGM